MVAIRYSHERQELRTSNLGSARQAREERPGARPRRRGASPACGSSARGAPVRTSRSGRRKAFSSPFRAAEQLALLCRRRSWAPRSSRRQPLPHGGLPGRWSLQAGGGLDDPVARAVPPVVPSGAAHARPGRRVRLLRGPLRLASRRIEVGGGSYVALDLGGDLEGGVVECDATRPSWLPYVEVRTPRGHRRARALGAAVLLGPGRVKRAGGASSRSPPAGDRVLAAEAALAHQRAEAACRRANHAFSRARAEAAADEDPSSRRGAVAGSDDRRRVAAVRRADCPRRRRPAPAGAPARRTWPLSRTAPRRAPARRRPGTRCRRDRPPRRSRVIAAGSTPRAASPLRRGARSRRPARSAAPGSPAREPPRRPASEPISVSSLIGVEHDRRLRARPSSSAACGRASPGRSRRPARGASLRARATGASARRARRCSPLRRRVPRERRCRPRSPSGNASRSPSLSAR